MSKFRTRYLWPLATVILAITLLIVFFSGSKINAISEEKAEEKVANFINENLLEGRSEVEVKSIEETSGLYLINLEMQGQELPVYLSKDGAYLFPQGINLEEFKEKGEEKVPEKSIDITITEEDNTLGEKEASVVIVEYSDFECPFCKEWHGVDAIPSRPINEDKAWEKLKKEYIDTKKVRFVFRHFPLSFHANAPKAAEAAECAGDQNKFWEMHELLFNILDLSLDNIKEGAKELKLDMTQFNTCLDSSKYKEKVESDTKKGAESGVSGTPAFIINGKLISGAVPFESIKAEIEKALAA